LIMIINAEIFGYQNSTVAAEVIKLMKHKLYEDLEAEKEVS
jgi:hypothetical protein